MSHEDLKLSGKYRIEFEECIAKAIIIFDLKELLTCCSLSPQERITFEIALDGEDGEILSCIEIPPREKNDFSAQPSLDLEKIVLHKFLNPAEVLFELRKTLPDAAMPSNDSEVVYKLSFSYGSIPNRESRIIHSKYRKCPPPVFCCWY